MAVDTSAMNWNQVLFRAADAYLNGTGDNPPILDDILTALNALVAASADEAPVGVFAPIQYVDVTLSVDAGNAYASGDLIADTQIVPAAVRANDAPGYLQFVEVVDEDNQGAAFTILFFSESTSLGSENSAPVYTDAIIRNILHRIDVATGDYDSYGSVAKVAEFTSQNAPVIPKSGTDDIYVAVVNGAGTPTYSASGLKLRIGILS